MESERPSLPTGVKVTGWIFLFVGIWNLLGGIIVFSFKPHPGSLSAVPFMRYFLVVNTAWAGLAVLASTGLLLRKEWGRRAAVAMVCFFMAIATAWFICNIVFLNLRNPPTTPFSIVFRVVSSGLAGLFLLTILIGFYLLARYLGKEKVRTAFRR